MRRLPHQFLLRYAANVLRAHFGRGSNRKLVKPMIAGLYVTMKCNFRCTYCDDGSGQMYPDIPEQRLSTAKTIEVLEILRRASPGLNITGGEPTVRPDIEEIFENIGRLGFCPVTFNTNAFLLDKHLTALHHIDYLVISLDSSHEERGDELINLSKSGQTARVKRNILLAKEYRREHKLKFDFIINTVIFPETIDDAWDVFEFCIENDFYWTPMPYIVGKYPCPGLVDNPRWQQLIDEVARAKRNGARVYGNMEALRTIRDFKRFECYPTTHPIVYPHGDLFYPCAPLNLVAGNLLEIGDYYKAMEHGERQHGIVPYCDARCHVGCYTEGSTAITHPSEGIAEAVRHLYPRPKMKTVLRRPESASVAAMPPAFHELRAMPSLPPDTIRQLRRENRLQDDWTSRVRIQGEESLLPPVKLTRERATVANSS
jgi:MoaA/NifB/PqqE/SkfB family radical SAM enzyme